MIDPALIRHAVPARLLTARLELRRDAVEDAPAICEAVLRSRAELSPWLDWLVAGYDLKEAERAQRRAREYWDGGDSFQWRLWQRTADRAAGSDGAAPFLGSIDLHTIDWDDRTAELGYWLDTPAAGQGFILEAGAVILRVAFDLLGFARVSLRCHPQNTRSLATARRLGFVSPFLDGGGAVCLSQTR